MIALVRSYALVKIWYDSLATQIAILVRRDFSESTISTGL